jgi:hypothetical protein
MTGLRECIEEMAQIRDIGAEFGLTLEQLMPALGKLQPATLAEMDPEELAAAMAG